MLERADRNQDSFKQLSAGDDSSREELSDLDRLVAAARRQLRVIAASCVVSVLLGVAYLATAAPQFTASAALLIDHRKVRAVQDSYDVAQGDMMGSAVDSQVELLRSDRIAFAVIDKLQLQRDPDFSRSTPGLMSRMISAVFGRGAQSEDAATKQSDNEIARLIALDRVRGGLEVKRVQRTLVLEIRFRSIDRHKAARIADAFADSYLTDQLDSKYEATRRASSWLLDRMAELKQQVLTSDLAIQKFRADNDLISSGGKLVNEQQLGEVNTQLVTARAETAKADARYSRIKSIIDNRQTDAVVTEAIGNNTIEQLRSKFLVVAKREAELSTKLGNEHGAVVGLRNEMREYERLMFDELSRIAESYLSELLISQSREKSLRGSLEGLVGITANANSTAVALRELERESETFRTLYQTFLQRYQEAVQQQSFPITEARIITAALTPTGPSHPKRSIVLLLSLLLGGAAGVAIGAVRELRDRTYRTEEQIRQDLGVEFLGMLPALAAREQSKAWFKLPPRWRREAKSDTHKQVVLAPAHIMRHAIDNPLSAFAETLRAIKISADLTLDGRMPRTLGIVSALPDEGKSTVAKNLASLLAHQGARTILIDTDLRNPGLSRRVAPKAEVGLLQAVLDGTPLRELILREEDSKLAVLPVVLQRRLPHVAEFLASAGMRSVLKQAEQDFDWIILDLPPLGPVVDARAIASEVDGFVFVVEWGRTSRRLVRATLQSDRQIRDKCLGVVLNKVDMKDLGLYGAYGSKAYYNGQYGNYYQDGT